MSDSFKEYDFRIIKDLLDIIDFVLSTNNFESSSFVRIKRDRNILIDFTQSAIKKQESLLS
jgi:hypothetical protein